jgi:response regulator of citrate/malate metabolism
MKKINILLLEDNPADAKFVEIQLKKAFGDAIFLQNCSYLLKAKQLVENNIFNVIILDLCLPDSNGLETLKNFGKISKTSVIIYTGISDEFVITEAKRYGAIDFLIKGKTTVEHLKLSVLKSIKKDKSEKVIKDLIKN